MTNNCNIVFDFVSEHSGEYWYRCTYCGARDWFSYYSQPHKDRKLGNCTNSPPEEPKVSGKTLEQWRQFARQDDCLDQMVPSDLRQLLAQIERFK